MVISKLWCQDQGGDENFRKNKTYQFVSTDTWHDKIIGTLCIVAKMPLVIHPKLQDIFLGRSCFFYLQPHLIL